MVKKNTSWGGRFKKQTAEKAQKFSSSINVDKKLYKEDISGSVAYAEALQSAGVINKSELAKIKSGLKQIKQKIESDKFNWQEALEDVHMNIESALEKIIGSAAKKLHTGRSRNDQVVTDLKLHLLEKSKEIKSCITDLLEVLVLKAESEVDTLMPGFTHMQIAQPITLGHHLMAWFEMLSRDLDRFEECEIRLKISPLGSGALAGNKFKINRMKLAKSLGFSEITKNSIDAVSDRDYVIEMLFNISLMGVHLSRISEELIIWSSSQFDYVDLPEELCTGSSIMPQKKNPDMAELVRGGSSKTIGNLVTLLSLIKNQPLSYNRDNQEDKGPLFDSIEYALGSLDITTAMIAGAEFNHDSMLTDVYDGHICATDLAEYLVMKGIPFRDAHAISGKAVQLAETSDLLLSELSLKDLKKLNALIEKDVFKHLDPLKSITSKSSIGGTAPSQVLKQIAHAKDKLKL
ncbi:MAG: argininosuccinate lyase [Gammaproteobacteria bacterium TMED222]|jgi:argininosuccinate lyase|nr:argininosuccinate lyase [SAR86 cluster bacterium]OUW82671.1 MAG: argininosuccinate lyase [Gammaproteobacteria bacterium TMED222]|tara:strand:+ start:1248 stop:2633 length:1386 start_codon:yes stop_codon:yes gene_type:complete